VVADTREEVTPTELSEALAVGREDAIGPDVRRRARVVPPDR
jgi:hypothetical protein